MTAPCINFLAILEYISSLSILAQIYLQSSGKSFTESKGESPDSFNRCLESKSSISIFFSAGCNTQTIYWSEGSPIFISKAATYSDNYISVSDSRQLNYPSRFRDLYAHYQNTLVSVLAN